MVAAKRKPTETEESDIFAPCSFSSLGLHTTLCEQLEERLGFKAPTLVQAQAIPVILSGRHVLVNAATGTGKTVAYLAPVIHHLHLYQPRIQRSDGTSRCSCAHEGAVFAGSRDSAQGVHRFHWIVPGYVMGGENRSKEKARLRKGISILVATPGRLLDHLKNTSSFVHTNLRWIIFDEADRILELGFGKEIEEILDLLGSRQHGSAAKNGAVTSKYEFPRQNLLLSATLNEKVNHLAKMNNRLFSEDYRLPAQLTQKYVKVPCNARLAVLLSILKYLFERQTSEKIVLFFSTCDAVDFHYSLLNAELKQRFVNCKTFRLHGNMEQEDRRTAFETFKREKSRFGFPKVKCIIQYDSPGEATEYVHRFILFLQPIEMDYLKELEKHGVSLTEFPLVKILDSFPLYGHKHVRKFVSIDAHPWVMSLQKALEAFTDKPDMKTLAKNTFCSWVRAYTAHRGELKRIFMVKKLHLGHVAKSFALKDQPSLVGKSFHNQEKKRKRDEKHKGSSRKRKKNARISPAYGRVLVIHACSTHNVGTVQINPAYSRAPAVHVSGALKAGMVRISELMHERERSWSLKEHFCGVFKGKIYHSGGKMFSSSLA
ncbi:DEAD-box ATP-dependent RNA helicase 17-like [Pyrus ussuriensis x Pyrus communis]|uniref:ATP-dependent RNA helicase n=1 Tax=Pyrus ussuriensis x Pyrus communis TaxID=2448454 RepID=A0A5N5IF28_9ROSA|nr:DEAD-box ATP-dependent RNA helicase 17-like [Pyrus ussuriensis x Pyrus communis]